MKIYDINKEELIDYYINQKHSIKECAEYLGINPNRVSRCLVGERKGQKLHGYSIEFVDNRR